MKQKSKYVHHEKTHNSEAPSVIVPIIIDILKPKSVVDVGCGIGTFLTEFQKLGIEDIRGYDGHWVNREQLTEYIDPRFFIEANLEQEISIDRRFDLAICLEVAEHLKESSSDNLVKTLTSLSDVILFSASIPGQMGQNHINEQWPSYWSEKFDRIGYRKYDVMRPLFWKDERIPRWYKQNMFLFISENVNCIPSARLSKVPESMENLVHPEYFNIRLRQLQQSNTNCEINKDKYLKLVGAQESFWLYLKLMIKSLIK